MSEKKQERKPPSPRKEPQVKPVGTTAKFSDKGSGSTYRADIRPSRGDYLGVPKGDRPKS